MTRDAAILFFLVCCFFFAAWGGCAATSPKHFTKVQTKNMMPPAVAAAVVTPLSNGCVSITFRGTNRIWCHPPPVTNKTWRVVWDQTNYAYNVWVDASADTKQWQAFTNLGLVKSGTSFTVPTGNGWGYYRARIVQ